MNEWIVMNEWMQAIKQTNKHCMQINKTSTYCLLSSWGFVPLLFMLVAIMWIWSIDLSTLKFFFYKIYPGVFFWGQPQKRWTVFFNSLCTIWNAQSCLRWEGHFTTTTTTTATNTSFWSDLRFPWWRPLLKAIVKEKIAATTVVHNSSSRTGTITIVTTPSNLTNSQWKKRTHRQRVSQARRYR